MLTDFLWRCRPELNRGPSACEAQEIPITLRHHSENKMVDKTSHILDFQNTWDVGFFFHKKKTKNTCFLIHVNSKTKIGKSNTYRPTADQLIQLWNYFQERQATKKNIKESSYTAMDLPITC